MKIKSILFFISTFIIAQAVWGEEIKYENEVEQGLKSDMQFMWEKNSSNTCLFGLCVLGQLGSFVFITENSSECDGDPAGPNRLEEIRGPVCISFFSCTDLACP